MSCSCCGRCGCQCGTLPYTFTVTFSGLPTQMQGGNCGLTFQSNFGDGADGAATPSGILLLDGGSCYARLGRVEPQITAKCSSGTGAEFEITLLEDQECPTGFQSWTISGIDVTGGSGYRPESTVVVIHAVGDTAVASATAVLHTDPARSEPSSLEVNVPGGSGAVVAPTIAPTAWGFDSLISLSGSYAAFIGDDIYYDESSTGDVFQAAPLFYERRYVLSSPDADVFPDLECSFSSHEYADGLPYWSVSSITVTGGISGYLGQKILLVAYNEDTNDFFGNGVGVFTDEPACGVVSSVDGLSVTGITVTRGGRYYRTSRPASYVIHDPGSYYRRNESGEYVQPSAFETASPSEFTTKPTRWGVVECVAEAGQGGSGYRYGSRVTVTPSEDAKTEQPFAGTAVTQVEAPTVEVFAEGGSGAKLAAVLEQDVDDNGDIFWRVDEISVAKSGKEYAAGAEITASVMSGEVMFDSCFRATVESVAEDGGIESVLVGCGGKFRRDTGVLVSVRITDAGRYYTYSGEPAGVEITNRGRYFREDTTVPPYVADVTVSACGSGEVTATIDQSPSSPTFGQITDLAGDGTSGDAIDSCNDQINGRAFVLRASSPEPLVGLCVKSCFGSGAVVQADGRDRVESDATCACAVLEGDTYYRYYDYDGSPSPIKRVAVIGQGSGYARVGTVTPVVSIAARPSSTGSGATFTPTLVEREDDCGLPYWEIESVAVSGGACYGTAGRTRPTLTAKTARGAGAEFTFLLYEDTDECGGKFWTVDGIGVQGGCGYFDGDTVEIIAPPNVAVIEPATATLNATDGCGAMSVSVTNGGKYFIKGPDESLRVLLSTADDKEGLAATLTLKTDDSGVPTEVEVVRGGVYYREDRSIPPHVADVTIEVDQATGSSGSGAEFSVTVGSDLNDPENFGKILGVEVVNGGSGYTLYGRSRTCTYVGGCNSASCDTHESPAITLTFPGGGRRPEVRMAGVAAIVDGQEQRIDAVFRADESVADCNALPDSAAVLYGATSGTVTITPGGLWQTGGTLCCGPRCGQFYMRDEYGEPCAIGPFDSVTIEHGSESKTVTDVIQSEGYPLNRNDTLIEIAGPWSYTCSGYPPIEARVYASINYVSKTGAAATNCGCTECIYSAVIQVWLDDGSGVSLELVGIPQDNIEFTFDRCSETTQTASMTIPASVIESIVLDNLSVIAGERPDPADPICPPGLTPDGVGGCYQDDTYTSDLICDGDPGYEAAVANPCPLVGQQLEVVPGTPGTVTAGVPVTMFEGCIACQYTIRTTLPAEDCPEGYARDENGVCQAVGCYWDTWPPVFADTDITVTIDHDEPCDPPNCECNPLP